MRNEMMQGGGAPGGDRMPEDPNQIFDMFDFDKNGLLDEKEFQEGVRSSGADRDMPMDLIMKQYNNFDMNKDGLDRDEFMALFSVMNDPNAQTDLIWASIGSGGKDGKIDVNELMAAAASLGKEGEMPDPKALEAVFGMMD